MSIGNNKTRDNIHSGCTVLKETSDGQKAMCHKAQVDKLQRIIAEHEDEETKLVSVMLICLWHKQEGGWGGLKMRLQFASAALSSRVRIAVPGECPAAIQGWFGLDPLCFGFRQSVHAARGRSGCLSKLQGY